MARGSVVLLGLTACSFRHGAAAPGDGRPGDASSDAKRDARQADAEPDAGPTGLVAWYQMETISGNVAPDSSGNDHMGACTSCPVVVSSIKGQGYAFSSGDRIDVPSEGGLAAMTGFTIAFWVQLNAALPSTYACPVNKGLGAGLLDSWQLCFAPPDAHFYFSTADLNGYDVLTSTTTMPVDEWHHIAISWDGSIKQIWYDGTSVASSGPDKPIAWDVRVVTIGADVDNLTTHANAYELPGELDDLRIYDHALTPQELFTLSH